MKIPRNRPLTNLDIERFARSLKLPNFRGVFMRDALPKKIHPHERGIVNLDNKNGSGTHRVAYKESERK